MSQSIKNDHISESTVARIAGNIVSGRRASSYGSAPGVSDADKYLVWWAVEMARMIADEVRRTVVEGATTPHD